MVEEKNPPKSVKVLAVLNELGKSGTANLLYHYKKTFPSDYMHLKLLIAHLAFLHENQKIKRFHNSYKGKSKLENPQTYIIDEGGKYYLRKWKLI